MNVTIIGTGYVGLVSGCCLAELGHTVVCVDNHARKVASLKRGILPIYEPGLSDLLERNVQAGRLTFTTNLTQGVSQARVIFLALPTPPQDDGSADLSAILSVAGQLGCCLPPHYCVIVNKSTVPVGTAAAVRARVAARATTEFDVVSNPEFLREGHAIKDFLEPERIAVGVTNRRAEKVMRLLYEPLTAKGHTLYVTTPATAELAKYAANAFLATKVSFINEIARLSDRLGADIDQLRTIIGADSRIGPQFLLPGIGYGGSCFPKDVRALKHMADNTGYDFKLLSATIAVNRQQQYLLLSQLRRHFRDRLSGKTFAVWGLAFKPETDDIREAPALVIIDELLRAGACVVAYDPQAGPHAGSRYANDTRFTLVEDKYAALSGAAALLIATEWGEFGHADLNKVAGELREPLVFDGRNVFQPEIMQQAGFSYYSVGRRPLLARPAPGTISQLKELARRLGLSRVKGKLERLPS